MIVKRKEETIELENGTRLHCIDKITPKGELQQTMEDAKKAYEDNPILPNKLDYLYAKADNLFANDKREEAIEYLQGELEMIHDLNDNPPTLLKWIDVNSLMAEMLIRVKDLDGALKYADTVIECAEENFYDTLEFVYAEELYGTVLILRGEYDKGEKWISDALSRIDTEIQDAEQLKANMEKTIKQLKEK